MIPGSERSPGEGNGNPLQYSCLENPMEGGAWWAIVHGVAKGRTRLSDFYVFYVKDNYFYICTECFYEGDMCVCVCIHTSTYVCIYISTFSYFYAFKKELLTISKF